jgi:hypothetical protein
VTLQVTKQPSKTLCSAQLSSAQLSHTKQPSPKPGEDDGEEAKNHNRSALETGVVWGGWRGREASRARWQWKAKFWTLGGWIYRGSERQRMVTRLLHMAQDYKEELWDLQRTIFQGSWGSLLFFHPFIIPLKKKNFSFLFYNTLFLHFISGKKVNSKI